MLGLYIKTPRAAALATTASRISRPGQFNDLFRLAVPPVIIFDSAAAIADISCASRMLHDADTAQNYFNGLALFELLVADTYY